MKKKHQSINLPDLAPKKNGASSTGPLTVEKFIPVQIAPRKKHTIQTNNRNLTKDPEECREIKMSFSQSKKENVGLLNRSSVTPVNNVPTSEEVS